MLQKIVFSLGILICLAFSISFVSLSCDDSPTTVDNPGGNDTEKVSWAAAFQLVLRKEVDSAQEIFDSSANIVGDGAESMVAKDESWETVMTDGDCKLLAPPNYFCEPSCSSGFKCTKDGCVAIPKKPKRVDLGKITVSGVKTVDGISSFLLGDASPYSQVEELAYPPFQEGDEVTFSGAGTSEVNPFVIKAKGIGPLILHNDSIPCVDGQPITLEWDPPKQQGNSFIELEIDVSYHSITKARIVGKTADDGSITIKGEILDKLKSYGVAGFPRLKIFRKATFTNESKNAQLTIESQVIKYLQIPGLISCNGKCPDGMTCGVDRLCH
ncbi:MAG TPA: hypothetical protein VHP36_10125 [Chitinispirillaceae bacterium]|nr:hypothetical protein [Chitinispirillaceae bacterium]